MEHHGAARRVAIAAALAAVVAGVALVVAWRAAQPGGRAAGAELVARVLVRAGSRLHPGRGGAPGVAGSAAARRVLRRDRAVGTRHGHRRAVPPAIVTAGGGLPPRPRLAELDQWSRPLTVTGAGRLRPLGAGAGGVAGRSPRPRHAGLAVLGVRRDRRRQADRRTDRVASGPGPGRCALATTATAAVVVHVVAARPDHRRPAAGVAAGRHRRRVAGRRARPQRHRRVAAPGPGRRHRPCCSSPPCHCWSPAH